MTDVASGREGDGVLPSQPVEHVKQGAAPRTGRRVWPWIVLVLIAGGAIAWWQRSSAPAGSSAKGASPARAVPVVVSKARTGDLPIYIDGLGTVTAFNTVTVRTRVDGELVKVAFTEGQPVHQGDLLAEIDSRPFEVQLAQAEGQLARDGALLRNAKVDLNRYEEARAAVPLQQIDTAAANVAQYEAAIKVDQSQVDNAKLQLVYCRITSPLDGVIGLRLVDQGNTVHASDASGLATITQLQPIAVVFSIPQDDLPDVLHAMAGGELPAEAYDRDLKKRLALGHLQAVDNQINASTGTVRLKAMFDNKDAALYPNQFVNVRLLVDTRKGAVLIPAAAIQRSPRATFVYVLKPDQTVEVRPVTLGPSERESIVVTQGIASGETVVTDGVDKLQDGTKVSARDEAGAAEDAKKDSAKNAKKDARTDERPAALEPGEEKPADRNSEQPKPRAAGHGGKPGGDKR